MEVVLNEKQLKTLTENKIIAFELKKSSNSKIVGRVEIDPSTLSLDKTVPNHYVQKVDHIIKYLPKDTILILKTY